MCMFMWVFCVCVCVCHLNLNLQAHLLCDTGVQHHKELFLCVLKGVLQGLGGPLPALSHVPLQQETGDPFPGKVARSAAVVAVQ